MARVTFIDPDGQRRTVEGGIGQSVMHVARQLGITGIIGECGGSRACATCHVYVAAAWRAAAGDAGADESDLLDFVDDRRAGSRLSCQIRLTPVLDGLIVTTPDHQG